MAKGKKTGGKDFGNGNRANPIGAGAHNKDLKRVRRLTQQEVSELGTLILDHNLAELTAIAKDPYACVLKVWFASIAVKAISRGDANALNAILDRIVGKPKEHIEVTGADGGPLESSRETADEREARQKRISEKQARLDSLNRNSQPIHT